MPRMAISAADARAIADHFIPARPAPARARPRPGSPQRGRELYLAQRCGRCHQFSGSGLEAREQEDSADARLAPDLRHTRERMSALAVWNWLVDPGAIKPGTRMPRPALTEAERADMLAFLLEIPLAPLPVRPIPERLPVLARSVRYEEVERRVFKRICWHCHSDPEPNAGDGGPGNTGGFGFRGKRLDLGSYEAVRRGGRDAAGARIDVLAGDAAGVPLIVARMMARHAEVAGKPVGGVRGMPLGLPPMSLEEIQLVETWIAQGARK